jgi:1-acyl-sn-glycerol-3-phosphate acyltransferase
LLYRFLKILVSVAIKIFCRKIIINKRAFLKEKGPLLLASNHPNSFLDSVILDTLFDQPIWSLARGDVFKNKIIIRILTAVKILPVYRTSEGVENLSENYKTFDTCINLFKKNAVVMIFSEGKCINEWHLRKLKKGTARLAMKTWQENVPLKVLPVGINYSSFRRFGKNVFINFGTIISKEEFDLNEAEGLRHHSFNNKLQRQFEELVFEIPKADKQKQEDLLEIKPSLLKKIILAAPAAIGWTIHAPLYLPVKRFTLTRTFNNDHYDSIMTAILLFTYPVYLLLLSLLLFLLLKSWYVFLLLPVLPFTAWSYVQLKPQLDK